MSSAAGRVAVVTGSNKGIGFAVVKQLCEKFDGTVYLTSRDEGRGKNAIAALEKLGLKPAFHQLDIGDRESVERIRDHLVEKYGGLDVLVNNAAIAFKHDATEPQGVQAEVTLQTNFFDTLRVCEILFPILRPHARVVNVSSSVGFLGNVPSKELRDKFSADSLTIPELSAMMQQYIEDCKAEKQRERGWMASSYGMSKVGLSALTRIQQRQFDQDPREDIVINHIHPGYVDTDMTSHKGPLTIDEGRVAVVTGSNKGVGLATVKQLCRKFDGTVYLTSRDEARGRAAVAELEKDGVNPKFHQLDIGDRASIERLRDHLKEEYGGLDVLVNNAAIAFKQNATEPQSVQAEMTLKTNYFNTLMVCDILFPILRPHARVVNVSSLIGLLSRVPSEELREKFASEELTIPELNALMQQYINDCKAGIEKNKGWMGSSYGMSKIGLSALTRIQQRQFDQDPREDIVINHVHPGYVDTDMSSHKGPLTIDQGTMSSAAARVAVVTGGNKGIGKEIVKQLITKFKGEVYLTARDEKRGKAAVEDLERVGLFPRFHLLDINQRKSIETFRDHLNSEYGGLDILINNAGILIPVSREPFYENAVRTIQTNYFGTKLVCDILFPLLRPHARVVNVSSALGHPTHIPGSKQQEILVDPSLSRDMLDDLMRDFLKKCKEGKQLEAGWGMSAYKVSKAGLSALSIIQQKEFDSDPRQDLIVNHVHPGYVQTDLTEGKGKLLPEQGLGREIAKQITYKFTGTVYISGLDEEEGRKAVAELAEVPLSSEVVLVGRKYPSLVKVYISLQENVEVRFMRLNVTNLKSIHKAREKLNNDHGGLDILVNNAAIKHDAVETITTNYTAVRMTCDQFFPLLRRHARVVNISSALGHLTFLPSKTLRRQFANPYLTHYGLDQLVERFLTACKRGRTKQEGWPDSSYTMSKIALSCLTRIQQRHFDSDRKLRQKKLIANHVNPGWISTHLSNFEGDTPLQIGITSFQIETEHYTLNLTVSFIISGALPASYAALLPPNAVKPKGKFIWNGLHTVDWIHGPLPR
ncbi:unnamed protein product [Cyprideis torosa]|uniref:carbonyl reductase (NADPH) n=1 Tax=Cyprideis torosa TaxID=163714 RepID=A0A7R8W6W1_9CRUS|nr:unnamed protein product [Cyprideis torosa]CAG0881512.1 unnamed protein product [Cyprideis torosa]